MEEEGLLTPGHAAHPKPRRFLRLSLILRKLPSPSRLPRSATGFILTALLSGLCFYLFAFVVFLSHPALRSTSHDYIFGPEEAITNNVTHTQFHTATWVEKETVTFSIPPPPLATPTFELPRLASNGLLELPLDELKDMVRRTDGYLARDWSLSLGWNNMRYIIEAAILDARLLNRTLVLPSFVYARACEYDITVCAKYAQMVNRGDALHSDEWRNIPLNQQMGWKIPLEMMVDIPYLRSQDPTSSTPKFRHNVLLTSEFLALQGLNHTRVKEDGAWDREYYHSGVDFENWGTHHDHALELGVLHNDEYDPRGVVRVDTILPMLKMMNSSHHHHTPRSWANGLNYTSLNSTHSTISDDADSEKAQPSPEVPKAPTISFAQRCNTMLHDELNRKEDTSVLEWGFALWVVETAAREYNLTIIKDEDIQMAIHDAGWVVLHTWEGAGGMDYVKAVVNPMRQVTPMGYIHAVREEFSITRFPQRVLLLEGELHLGRKPGNVRFTSLEGRDDFARIVLYDIRPPAYATQLADRIIKKMDHLNGGRSWLSAHMRRGDFARLGWSMEASIENHFGRIKRTLDRARSILEHIRLLSPKTYDVPDVVPNMELFSRKPPLPGDYIYLATDERDDQAIRYLGENGAKLFNDLVSFDDRREFGWPLLFSDTVSLVEQWVIGHGAAYFYGHAMSSVAGGILNQRAAFGCDFRTALFD